MLRMAGVFIVAQRFFAIAQNDILQTPDLSPTSPDLAIAQNDILQIPNLSPTSPDLAIAQNDILQTHCGQALTP